MGMGSKRGKRTRGRRIDHADVLRVSLNLKLKRRPDASRPVSVIQSQPAPAPKRKFSMFSISFAMLLNLLRLARPTNRVLGKPLSGPQ